MLASAVLRARPHQLVAFGVAADPELSVGKKVEVVKPAHDLFQVGAVIGRGELKKKYDILGVCVCV